MAIMLEFEKPNKKDYHLEPQGECPPLKRGDSCYGDCADCYHMERDTYNRREKRMMESPDTKR